MSMRGTRTAAVFAAAGALLAAPAAAPGAVTCDLSGTLLTVDVGATGDNAQLRVVSGEITVAQGVSPVTCTGGTPTVTNTGSISVTDSGGDSQNVSIHGADDFAPGPDPQDGSDNPSGTKELEIFVNLDGGAGQTLQVTTGDDSDRIVFGTNGINTNPIGETFADVDIFLVGGVESLVGRGGSGPDELFAQGRQGTGGVLTRDITLDGAGGIDQIEGGDGSDTLFGGDGGDTLFGGGGDDSVQPGAGNDIVNGAGGDDTVGIHSLAQPVTVDLAITGSQDTGQGTDTLGGFENAQSAAFLGATLRGNDGPNTLTSAEGNDTLEGRGGEDVLVAGEGADTLLGRDGGPDTLVCGEDSDTATIDPPGLDTVVHCERVIFPPPPESRMGSEDAGPGNAGGGQVSVAAFGPQTLVSLGLAGNRIPARGPLAVRVTNANAFDVTGRLAGETTNRLSAAQRRRRIRLRPKSFTVPANARTTVRLRLPAALRRQLARRRRLSLRVTASVRDPAGNSRTVRKTLRPRLRRR